jgi:hypothetical protein
MHCRLMAVQGQVLTALLSQKPGVIGSVLAAMYQHFDGLASQIEHREGEFGANHRR